MLVILCVCKDKKMWCYERSGGRNLLLGSYDSIRITGVKEDTIMCSDKEQINVLVVPQVVIERKNSDYSEIEVYTEW
jgi:hypothetical protein